MNLISTQALFQLLRLPVLRLPVLKAKLFWENTSCLQALLKLEVERLYSSCSALLGLVRTCSTFFGLSEF
jgi:hypothetical protein